MVGTLFPRESNDNCIESVETPKTVVLQMDLERSKVKLRDQLKQQN